MDWTQILLLVIISVVATLLITIGIQLIFLLKETKKSLEKVDNILSDVEFMSRSLTRSSISVGHLVDSVKSGLELAGAASKMVSALTASKKQPTQKS